MYRAALIYGFNQEEPNSLVVLRVEFKAHYQSNSASLTTTEDANPTTTPNVCKYIALWHVHYVLCVSIYSNGKNVIEHFQN